MKSIYDIPHIKFLMQAERKASDPEVKRSMHNALMRAIKSEQVIRGQRTPKAGA